MKKPIRLYQRGFTPVETPTRAQIENAQYTRGQLMKWGVSWPPPKGWRQFLLQRADEIYGSTPKPKPRQRQDYSAQSHYTGPEELPQVDSDIPPWEEV